MNKDQLQKELKEKIKAGIKPSDLKKSRTKSSKSHDLPPPISIDEGYQSDKSDKSTPLKKNQKETSKYPPIVSDDNIPTPPPSNSSILALKKQIELHKEIKKADEKKKQELEEKIKTLIKLAGEEKTQYQQKISNLEKTIQDLDYLLKTGKNSEVIKKLREENKNLIEKYINLENQVKNPAKDKEPTNKTFFCDSCQLTKQGNYIKRKVDAPFEPRLHGRICYLCSSCSPYTKELNELDIKDNHNQLYD